MQISKNRPEKILNNEYIKMMNSIQSDELNNVCFELEQMIQNIFPLTMVYLFAKNVFKTFSISPVISTIMINDLYSLNNNE